MPEGSFALFLLSAAKPATLSCIHKASPVS